MPPRQHAAQNLGPISMHLAGRTDVGLIREHNEDGFLIVDLALDRPPPPSAEFVPSAPVRIAEKGALIIVCDGMGGAAAGEVASSMALETVSSIMLSPPHSSMSDAPPAIDELGEKIRFARRLRSATFAANKRIHEASRSDEMRAGMGTTMTSVGVIGRDLIMAQVGDSRAYVLREGNLTQVTRDQSLVNQLLETGQITEEQARLFEHSNVILQALGVQEEVEVLLSTVALRRGDRIVVCTDGLTGVVSDEELASVLGSTTDMNEVCRLLIEMARAAGGPDNITVVAASFEGDALVDADASEKVTYERWYLDEPQPLSEVDDGERSSAGLPLAIESLEAPRPARRREDPARTFLSLMLILALTLGGLVFGSQLYRGGRVVRCIVQASPGLTIRVDGRDIGQRTRGGDTPLRLPPGKHRVGLRGPGAPSQEQTISVGGAGGGDGTNANAAEGNPADPRVAGADAAAECRVTFNVTP